MVSHLVSLVVKEDLVKEDLLGRGCDGGLGCEYGNSCMELTMMMLSRSLWVVMAVMLIIANLQLITLVILHLYI